MSDNRYVSGYRLYLLWETLCAIDLAPTCYFNVRVKISLYCFYFLVFYSKRNSKWTGDFKINGYSLFKNRKSHPVALAYNQRGYSALCNVLHHSELFSIIARVRSSLKENNDFVMIGRKALKRLPTV